MRRIGVILAALAAAWLTPRAHAHEVRPAYLEIRETAEDVYVVLWKVPASGDLRLGIYVRLPDPAESLTEPVGRFADGAYIETWTARCPGGLRGASITIDGLETTRIDVLARVEHLDGSVQTARLMPDARSFTVEASPSFRAVSVTYLQLGAEHILLGIDHLLFVLALVLLVKGWKRIVATITAFTIAHSITLALATLGWITLPGPPVEAIIALSIVFVAAEIVRGRQGRPGLTERAPWVVAFAFGLLHGLGFAGALGEVGLPQHAIPAALLFFNVGVEIGQIAFVAGIVLIAAMARTAQEQLGRRAPRYAWRVVPYAIGSVAMFWVIERVAGFG